MAKIIDGKALSQHCITQMAGDVQALKENGIVPGLAVIIVGEDDASQIYVRNKHRKAEKIGINSIVIRLSTETTQLELLERISLLNHDPKIDGILVQLPLPSHINAEAVLDSITPEKDVDGFHPVNVGKLWSNRAEIVPSTPFGIMKMLEFYNVDPTGKNAVIIGRSTIVGRPMAAMLLNANATVTIVHSQTKNLQEITQQADILVVAIGRSEYIKAKDIKAGAVVIDVGMNRDINNKLTGDVDYEDCFDKASLITPVPGGVGPMTITMLMQQTINIAKRRALNDTGNKR
ncbi:bifunctional methylenetetrahydrofolate dehydrogenase/methenyltetrahydrofolate cyclohydrolase FolD [Agrilactobacillus yilanensis]|uniref:Bifunctional protein FolD n=1 Tax=Agrilactobacillus yilanensis TaxID=2485997 RepID=A0ABW4J8V0_9LACO|nr:bifunctional methylenetetrahydrofolate dehydrogenase/methenyltetrahydrofolate cyclohydrolase FolD [Agrilactobacillus yilanensis]